MIFPLSRCPVCGAVYTTILLLQSHFKQKHGDSHVPGDLVKEHTKVLMTLGLMKAVHDKTIQVANGDLLMVLYKFMLIWFRANNMNNYSTGLLELQFQLRVLPAYLTHSIKWNRFVNTRGKTNSNAPMGKLVDTM